jgi:hypothetical protein
MVRRYPPEQFPQKFRRVKEAYEALSLDDEMIVQKVFSRRITTNLELAAFLFGDFIDDSKVDPAKDNEALDSLLALARGLEKSDNSLNRATRLLEGLPGKPIEFLKGPEKPVDGSPLSQVKV